MNIYLIETDSKVLLDEKESELIKNSLNVIKYNYKETSLSDILEEASYVSMFEEMKYLIIKNADFFGKSKLSDKESEILSNYIDNPYPLTTIIFTTYEEVDKRKALTKKIINQNGYISLKAPKGYELINHTKNLIFKNGYKVDDKTVRYIVLACLNSWDLINNEIKKFALYYEKKGTITKKDAEQIISSNAQDNEFKFVDAVINKDLELSIKLLKDLKILKVDPPKLFHLLVREYRLMLLYKILEKKNTPYNEILKELKLVDWQVKKVINNSNKYHLDDLKENLVNLSKIDYQIKSGQIDKDLSLELFLIKTLQY